MREIRLRACLAGLIIWGLATAAWAAAPAMPQVMFILDGSGSMWGPAGDQTKIEAAKTVLAQAVPALPPEVRAGLTAYGHRSKGDCQDVEILVEPQANDRQAILAAVQALNPKGKTPIAHSLSLVAESIKQSEAETTIVLVSDGLETCHDDPCGAVRKLKDLGIKFVLHVVGFGVDQKGAQQLSCLAQAGGGRYFAAEDAAGLGQALGQVQKEMVQKVEAAKTTKVAKKTGLGKLGLTMPAEAVVSLAGARLYQGEKMVKEAPAAADGLHPLMYGAYRLELLFANPNYQPPTPVNLGEYEVKPGETTEVKLGMLFINLAPGLDKLPTNAVEIRPAGSDQPLVRLDYHGNDYYFYKPKPLPAGEYDLYFHYAQSPAPTLVAAGIKVPAGGQGVATIDSGLRLKKAASGDVVGWDLTDPQGGKVLEARRRADNDYPLWEAFALPPGTYDLLVHLRGMAEPLPAAQGLPVGAGQTVEFDAGL